MAERPRRGEPGFRETVAGKERRRLRARERRDRGVWFWLGMFGMVGWSVAIPTVVGTAVGVWLDRRDGERISFTLVGLGAGIAVGCLIAWYWVSRESRT